MRATNWTKIIVVTTLCLFLLNLSSCVAPEAQRKAPVVSQPPVAAVPSEEGFVLAQKDETAIIYVDSEDWPASFAQQATCNQILIALQAKLQRLHTKRRTLGKTP